MNFCRWNAALLLILLSVAANGCADAGGSAADWTNESRVREDVIKAEADLTFVDAPAHAFKMTVETSFPSGDGPTRPRVAKAAGDGFVQVVENNSGRIFIGRGREFDELEVGDGLEFPSVLRMDPTRFHVSDNEGLKTFDYAGQRQMLMRTFLTIHDFVFVAPDVVAVNPIMARSGSPIVALVSAPGGAIVKEWGGARELSAPGAKIAHLASCGGRIVVGPAHDPVLFVLDERLESEVEIDLPFPFEADLLSLAADERLVEPAPGVVTAPTFVGGVACVDASSTFVLLDLPFLCILEYDGEGRLVGVHHADNLRQGRHYRTLDVTRETDGLRFVTIAEDATGASAVVEAVAVSRRGLPHDPVRPPVRASGSN